MSNFPANHKAPWTTEQEEKVLEYRAQDMPLSRIAELVGRTKGAVESRLETIARRLLDEGISEREVVKRTKLSAEIVHEIVEDRAFDMLELKSENIDEVSRQTGLSIREVENIAHDLEDQHIEGLGDILRQLTAQVGFILFRRLDRYIRQYWMYCSKNGHEPGDATVWSQWATTKGLPPYVIKFVIRVYLIMTDSPVSQ